MTSATGAAALEASGEIETAGATVLVGLPGLGLAGVIAVGHVTDQLGLPERGRLVSESFPRVATYADGRVRDPVRIYAGGAAPAVTVQADLLFPPRSHAALSDGVVEHLAEGCQRVVVPIGAPAETVDEQGEVTAVATTDDLRDDVVDAGIAPAPGVGAVGGPTGALLAACARAEVPAVALVVRVEPYRPDPGGARALLEAGLDPLVDFDVDAAGLAASEAELEREMEGMRRQMQRLEAEQGLEQAAPESEPSMFQ